MNYYLKEDLLSGNDGAREINNVLNYIKSKEKEKEKNPLEMIPDRYLKPDYIVTILNTRRLY